MSAGSDFRVVIAGASIAGLSLALALERAGVDFVVLEAHPSVAPQVGASIAVLPSGARVLDQLGCYADVAALVNCSTDNFIIRDAGGEKLIHIEKLEEHLVQRHGYPMIFLERRMVIDVLHKHIRQKDKVLTSRRVVGFETDEHGVSVECQDGSVHLGSILIGADGIRSTVGRQMSQLSGSSKKELPVQYRCLFGISDRVPGIAEDAMHHVTNYSSSLFASSGPNDRTYWCLFHNLGDTYYGDALPPYGEKEEAETAKVHGPDAVTDTVKFSDLYERRIASVSTPLHEGVLDKWYEGRCLVVGDAVHKVTDPRLTASADSKYPETDRHQFNPIVGLGGMSALETTAILTNNLIALLKSSPNPTRAEIESVFARTQASRQPRAKALVDASTQTQRRFAMQSPWLRFMNRYFYPAQGSRSALRLLSEAYPGAAGLDVAAARNEGVPPPAKGGAMPAWLPDRPAFRALPYEDELLRAPAPRTAFVSLVTTAALVGLGLLGLQLLLYTSLANGTFRLVDEAVWQRSVEVPGKGMVDLKDPFGTASMFSGLGELLTTLVAVFLPLVAEDVTNVSSLERKLHAGYFLVSVFLPIIAVMVVEGSRKRNVWSLIWSPSIWLTLAQLFGLGLIMPFYVLAFFFSSSQTAYWMPAERFVPERFSRAVLPALALGFLAPSALMAAPMVSAGVQEYTQQIIAFWQVTPVLTSWLAAGIARSLGGSAAGGKREALEDYAGLDVANLNRLYGAVFFVAASTHAVVMLAVVWVVRLSVAGIFLPGQTVGPVASIVEGVSIFIKYDLLLTVAATMVLCIINLMEMKRVGLIEGSTFKRIGWLIAGCAAVGPGATLVGLWKWRERKTARPELRAR
ncbi:hypothetical protein LA080_004309 [Diaporthe eres]|uniref:FAD-binding domain-containing protein n=1 Tax=Diaporthe vaccinii TaxID=105482 RepID=A0ABR4EYC2_9PEZI|nr:hypothetical protein LA080_004309 [Diaporthe eres]